MAMSTPETGNWLLMILVAESSSAAVLIVGCLPQKDNVLVRHENPHVSVPRCFAMKKDFETRMSS
jgi:hypothetical protein